MAAYIGRPSRRRAGSGTLASRLGLTGRHPGEGALMLSMLTEPGGDACPSSSLPLGVAAAMELVRSLMVLGEAEGTVSEAGGRGRGSPRAAAHQGSFYGDSGRTLNHHPNCPVVPDLECHFTLYWAESSSTPSPCLINHPH